MPEQVKLIECPRDAWQGLPEQIPTEYKAEYLKELVLAGFRHIDAVSFVSPKHVKQMADSEEVMAKLNASLPAGVQLPEIIGIVVNEKGLERAFATPGVTTIGYPYSISAYFRRANANMTRDESRMLAEKLKKETTAANRGLVIYISMAFGNPYDEPWGPEIVADTLEWLKDIRVRTVSLADTVGTASPQLVGDLYRSVKDYVAGIELGVHLHSRPENAEEKILAAYEAGCRRFDGALTGLGGCPFAGDNLVGNVATENVLAALRKAGADPGIDSGRLTKALEMTNELKGVLAMYSTLLLEIAENLATITLNRPEKRNAISTQMMAELLTALDQIEKSHARVIIVTGSGKAFCAGMDLEMLAAIAKQSPAENQEDSRRIAKMFRRIWSYPRPMIAAVNGPAYAGGCGIATLCDFTIAAPEAKFGYTEVKIGFLPAIVSVFLTRQIGEKRSRDLLLTGRILEAAEAKEFGLVSEVVPAEKLMERAHELANTLIAASPSSLTRSKHLLVSSAAAGVDHDLERAILENARIRCTPDFQEGLASFLEKRKPVWQGEKK